MAEGVYMDPSPEVGVSDSFKATITFNPFEDMVEEKSSAVVQPASMSVLTANATEDVPPVHLYQMFTRLLPWPPSRG
jgi:hypothetical protein